MEFDEPSVVDRIIHHDMIVLFHGESYHNTPP